MNKQELDLVYENFCLNGLDKFGEEEGIFDEVREYGAGCIKDIGYTLVDHGLIHSRYMRKNRFKYGFVGKKSDHRYDEYTLWIIKASKPDTIFYVKSWYVKK